MFPGVQKGRGLEGTNFPRPSAHTVGESRENTQPGKMEREPGSEKNDPSLISYPTAAHAEWL